MGQISKLQTELAQIFLCGRVGHLYAPLDEIQYMETIQELKRNYFGSKDKIRILQKLIQSNLEMILSGFEKLENKAELNWTPYEDAMTMGGVDLISTRINLDLQIKTIARPPFEFKHSTKKTKARWAATWRTDSTLQVLTIPTGNLDGVLLYAFYKALEAIPITAFRRCESCRKVFIHTSKRKRNYCSNLCAAKAGNKKRRQAIENKRSGLRPSGTQEGQPEGVKTLGKKENKWH